MSIYLTAPLWLLIGVAIVASVVYSRRKSLLETSTRRQTLLLTTRFAICFCVLLALAGLTIAFDSDERETIFLIDSSFSVDKDASKVVDDFIARCGVTNEKKIYFAGKTVFDSDDALSDEDKNESELERALFTAQATADPTRRSQIVLFSDGNETHGDLTQALNETRIPIAVVPLAASKERSLQLARVEAPNVARQGEPFEVEAIVVGIVKTTGRVSLYQNGALVERRDVEIAEGENRVRFATTANAADKELEIVATLEAQEEIAVGADSASAYVALNGKPKILVVAADIDRLRNFAAALRAQDLELETRPLEALPEAAIELEAFDEIVLADVPATALSAKQMDALNEYVRDFGGGLIATGGENSFGAGGYGHTALDALLPVASEHEKEKEKPSLAIALVIDRSGSMEGDKLELTKKAAQGVVELLSPQDFISVIAFDDAPREIVPIQNVSSLVAVNDTIGAISSDGSTNIFPALAKATDDLLRVNAKFKHIILLTDGLSVPGDYEQTIRRAVGGKITVSTVGIGSDADKFLLEKLASEGAGRCYFSDDPRSVPQIFMRETRLADKSAVNEEPFLALEENAAVKLTGEISIEDAPPLLGCAIVNAKPTSEIALTTEQGDPLLAFWRYGLGVSVAFMSDVDGRWSAEWLDWHEFSAFWAQVARYALRQNDSSNAATTIQEGKGEALLRVDVRDRNDLFLNNLDVTTSVVGSNGEKTALTLTQRAPGLYETTFPIENDVKYAVVTTAKQDEETLFTISRAFAIAKERETDVKAVDETKLRRIAETTGGVFDPTPEQLAASFVDYEPKKAAPLRAWLFALALLIFVADVYLRRID